MQAGDPSFEEIALRFVEFGATDALQVFLLARLQALAPDDKAQVWTGTNTLRQKLGSTCHLPWSYNAKV